jgi:hypothetical protein
MLLETVEGITGNEPFTHILATFQYTLLYEHEDAQMGGANQFRGFHDGYVFSRVVLLFHGDASTEMNCPADIGHLPGCIILCANRKVNLPVALESGFLGKVEGSRERSGKHRLPKTGAGCITNRHCRSQVACHWSRRIYPDDRITPKM